ncbi:MAG TPA: hypothetical protein VGE49_13630, partial [Brevundimonas sp.]
MSAQSVMSVIAPAASTAAGLGVSDDTAADGALFAALLADVSGAQDDAAPSADASATASVDAAAIEDATTAEAAAPGWLLAPVPAPIIPPMAAEAPATDSLSSASSPSVAPPLETAPAAPALAADLTVAPAP